MTGEDPLPGPHRDDQHADDSTDADASSLKLGAARRALSEFGQRTDLANAERERVAALLGELARCANHRGQLSTQVVAAFKIVAQSVDVSQERLRAAVADAVDGKAPA